MKKIFAKCIIVFLFLAGLSLLLYPLVANEWNNYRQNRLMSAYDNSVAEQAAGGGIDYETEWRQAREYNEELKPYILPDSFAAAAREGEPDDVYLSCLDLSGSGMMGSVEIPKINVRIPVFHTTEEEVLQMAAGHLEGSSLPVGGEGNHAVISAHRGLPSAALFTDLDRLEEGDYFLLHILDDVLCYQVDQITVTDPDDTSALAAEEEKDLVTLLTCTPYGVNSHRLLVRGVRVPYEEIEDEITAMAAYAGPSLHTNYLLWVLVGLAATASFILLLYANERRLRKKAAASAADSREDGQEEQPQEGQKE